YAKVIVSDREKTIIDSLRHPEYSGGISHIYESLPKNLNTDKLLTYCKKTNNSTIASRLGFILDKKEIEFERDELKNMIKTYSKLDPKKENKNLNSEWKLYVNRRIE
ncbi:MAG: type IV toxin-antitoxin system AbiEi family antitoxin domain-containing protein, partial [Thermoplasmatota archaeon]